MILAQEIGQPSAAILGDGRIMALRPRTFGETGYASAVELLDPAGGAWGAGSMPAKASRDILAWNSRSTATAEQDCIGVISRGCRWSGSAA